MTEQPIHPFVNRLQELAEKQERGALAALRRGLGQPPGTVAEMFRRAWPSSAAVYLPNGQPPKAGQLFRNKQLAATALFSGANAGYGFSRTFRTPGCWA